MYRQYLHQGGIASYKEFFDPGCDLLVQREGLIYEKLAFILRSYFSGKMLFLNYEGLRENRSKLYTFSQISWIAGWQNRWIKKRSTPV